MNDGLMIDKRYREGVTEKSRCALREEEKVSLHLQEAHHDRAKDSFVTDQAIISILQTILAMFDVVIALGGPSTYLARKKIFTSTIFHPFAHKFTTFTILHARIFFSLH